MKKYNLIQLRLFTIVGTKTPSIETWKWPQSLMHMKVSTPNFVCGPTCRHTEYYEMILEGTSKTVFHLFYGIVSEWQLLINNNSCVRLPVACVEKVFASNWIKAYNIIAFSIIIWLSATLVIKQSNTRLVIIPPNIQHLSIQKEFLRMMKTDIPVNSYIRLQTQDILCIPCPI